MILCLNERTMITTMNTLIIRGKKLSRFLKLKQTKTHLILLTFCFLTNFALSQDCDCLGQGITVGNPDEPYAITTLSNSDLPPQSYTGCLKVYGTLVVCWHLHPVLALAPGICFN